ncbi:PTS lactose/cellobiose transporter subunit IIA [Helcococcus massiliensis]|uniref:PTS lactose/cellobiose transporter subunit IIA n=1 Tax=Helcococcus massiliensis TaxID=2040290 RepID=UPI000CDEEE64|nr:PTS lactose/cellobiose transporter subunit IIA [Helcococcus massiliensis]
MEEIIMEIIVHSGNARSLSMEAIQAAKAGDFDKSEELLKEANDSFLSSHQVQTGLIQDEINGKPSAMSLLMVHAQDHLMNAQTVRDLAVEIIELYKNK